MDKEIRKEVDDAVAQAKADSEPQEMELYTNVYNQIPEGFSIRPVDPFAKQVPVFY